MKKKAVYLLIMISLLACSNQKRKIKSVIQSSFTAIYDGTNYTKDSMLSKDKFCYDKNGRAIFGFDLTGNKNDTLNIKQFIKETIDSITYYYEDSTKQNVNHFEISKSDTIKRYEIWDTKPELRYIYVLNDRKEYIETIDLLSNTITKIVKKKYNQYEDMVYFVNSTGYYPSWFDKKYLSPEEIILKKAKKSFVIIENEFEYY